MSLIVFLRMCLSCVYSMQIGSAFNVQKQIFPDFPKNLLNYVLIFMSFDVDFGM